MGLPAKKRTNRSKRDRASHFALETKAVAKCSNCGAGIQPHHACAACGQYRGKPAKDVAKRANRTLRARKTA